MWGENMNQTERERKDVCFHSGCIEYRRCKIKWGNECTQLGGSRVPRLDLTQKLIPPSTSWLRKRKFLVINGGPTKHDEVRERFGTGDVYFG